MCWVCLQLVLQYMFDLFAFGASEFVGWLAMGAAGCVRAACILCGSTSLSGCLLAIGAAG